MGAYLKEKHTLALIWTQYTLMLYMLVADDWKKTKLFLYKGRIGTNVIKRINEVGGAFFGGYYITLFACNKSKNILGRIIKKILCLVIDIYSSLWITVKQAENIKCFGYESIFCNTKFLDSGCSFIVLEDGVSTYMERQEAEKFWRQFQGIYVSNKYLPGGWSNKIDTVIFTGRKKIPVGLERKTHLVNLMKLWDECSEQRKKEFMYVFQFDLEHWMNLIKNGRDIVVITTNPFVKGMTSESWILFYKEILSHYDNNRIIIKPHPIDDINYEKLFPKCVVIRSEFPFEICRFVQLPLKKIVGVKSTALYGVWPKEMVDDYTGALNKFIHS